MLVAITSNDDTSDQGIISLYRGSAADLATVHFSRDIRTAEGGWLPVRNSYRAGRLPGVPPVISNEPIGPGSSVASESDPIKLCAAAVFAYLANLPAYVYHSRAGVYGYVRCCPPAGDEDRFETSAGINAYRFIRQILPPDLASWKRNDGLEVGAPLTVYCDNQPDRYWPEVSRPTDGCVPQHRQRQRGRVRVPSDGDPRRRADAPGTAPAAIPGDQSADWSAGFNSDAGSRRPLYHPAGTGGLYLPRPLSGCGSTAPHGQTLKRRSQTAKGKAVLAAKSNCDRVAAALSLLYFLARLAEAVEPQPVPIRLHPDNPRDSLGAQADGLRLRPASTRGP